MKLVRAKIAPVAEAVTAEDATAVAAEAAADLEAATKQE
jgi:hypothetical protein